MARVTRLILDDGTILDVSLLTLDTLAEFIKDIPKAGNDLQAILMSRKYKNIVKVKL